MKRWLITLVMFAASARANGACTDFRDLEEQLLATLLRFTPGTAVSEVTALPSVSSLGVEQRGEAKQAWFTLSITRVDASVVSSVWCSVAADDRLVACEAYPAVRIRFITQDQVDSIHQGEGMGSVLGRLCVSDVQVGDDGTLLVTYLVRMKERVDGQFDAKYVDLMFARNGSLASKDEYFK